MRTTNRYLAVLLSFMLVFSSLGMRASAEEIVDPTAGGAISIASDWQGSVFGDVGGLDKINSTNFEIMENADQTVTLRSSNDRGKMATGSTPSEGIAYYFKEVPDDADFELTATAAVYSWKANSQVSFGLMVRSTVFTNVHGAVYSNGDYVALGAVDQTMQAFYKQNNVVTKSSVTNSSFTYSTANPPMAQEQYALSIKKTGNNYVLKIGDETKTIENVAGLKYAGLYTARNATMNFSNVQLNIEKPLQLGDWTFAAFGGNTGTDKNPAPTVQTDGSVTMLATGGKIASSDEGISYYYKELPTGLNFELEAKALVNSFNATSSISTPNQKSFGLMVRDNVAAHGATSSFTSNYVAVAGSGGSPNVMQAIQKLGTRTLHSLTGVTAPGAGQSFDLKIRKVGDVYEATANGVTEKFVLPGAMNDTFYAGLYVARDANITFSDFKIKADTRAPVSITANASGMKTIYLIGEELNTAGLQVTATYPNGSQEQLTKLDYVHSGFESATEGVKTVTIHFNGATTTVPVEVKKLTVLKLETKYAPAKTEYYPGDAFDPAGFVLTADYNNETTADLTSDKYTFSIEGATWNGTSFILDTPGVLTVKATSVETPTQSVTFPITVKAAQLTAVEIRKQPTKTLYYIGDELSLDGLVVYAKYSDQSEVRLMKDDYTVSQLDTASAGSKQVTITHKWMSALLALTVKVKEATGVKVTKYPATTYTVGADFDPSGLQVSKQYDSGEQEVLGALQYTVDASGYDKTKAGTYDIVITPADTTLAPIALKVTVREAAAPVWKTIIFGQSSTSTKNSVTVNDTDQSVELVALEGGGKVTGDHDGISFYYTELDAQQDNFVLSADIEVKAYAKSDHDGQESFGIMARDAIGENGNSSVFASNIAAVGGYSGGTKEPNGTQLFIRTGIQSPDGAGSQGVKKIMLGSEKPAPSNTAPAKPYRLTLAKTNSGYVGQLNNGEQQMFFEPDILNVQNSKVYVGFYTARLATIVVRNIDFKVTSAATDAPKVTPPAKPVTPDFSVLSLDRTSDPNYTLRVKSNVSGVMTVKLGESVIAQDVAVQAGAVKTLPATLAASGTNSFSVTFLPNDDQYLTTYDKLVKNFTVTTKSYVPGGDIYVSPTGTSAGTGAVDQPLDLDTAIDYVRPGQRIVMLGGTYVRSSKVEIKKYNDGTATARKSLVAAPGTRPVLDFDKKSEGIVLSGHYWHVLGIDVKRSAGNTKGFTIGGSHNIIELVNTYQNGDTGLQISKTDDATDKALWPSHNLILNCTSYDNRDPSDNNADGFAAKLTSGVGNIFRGTIAHNNIDDGWDLYTKSGSGAIGAVTIENSIAYNNGFLTDGTVGAGDKNGFKLGGEGIHVPHIIRNSAAFGNGAYGFASNSNPGVIAYNNVAFNNAGGNMNFTTYSHIPTDFRIGGFVSYQKDYTAKDSYPTALASDYNYMFNGTKSVNKSGVELTAANFESLTPVATYQRDANGDIIWGSFLKVLGVDKFTEPVVNPGPVDPGNPSSPGGSDGESSDSAGAPAVSQPAANTDGSVTVKVTASKNAAGAVSATLDSASWQDALAKTKANAEGKKIVKVDVATSAAASGGYEVKLPAAAYKEQSAAVQVEVKTNAATVVLPGNMFKQGELAGAETVGLSVKELAPSGALKEKLGNRLVYEFDIQVDGKTISWSNPDAAVQVAIPYKRSEQETNPAFIVVWYIDPAGTIIPVVNGKYNEADGQVYFKTNHFSQYTVTYNPKTFADVAGHWAKAEVDVMAAKGVINGVTEQSFEPNSSITRADFTLLLVRALGLTSSSKTSASFSDVASTDYYYNEIGIAKQLGLVNGKDDGRFEPKASITRQDMIVIASRALQAASKLGVSAAGTSELDAFADRETIAAYAKSHIAAMVKAGFVQGDDQKNVNPLAKTTRAEAAVLIYRLMNE
ncbi:bacterial Ig-like domain-containing protein [Paenibacillus sp. YYML68]|uniref:bacterial Ig-like domain-containing protein n=1 Tax=Paenibacillus sp. YYML68 TaxID=2909250 RepID=UPI00249212E7|nr:bacterial Ig-like domain-containing protein [Paenibacillus sp. YYML68]